MQKTRLARARGADKGHAFALLDLESQILEYRQYLIARTV